MNSLEIIILILTAFIETGLAAALFFRSVNPEPEPQSYPHFKVGSKKFYRSTQDTDGTWEIE